MLTQAFLAATTPNPAGLQASDFRRPRLNLVVLLDVSGSMGSPFDSYYYDAGTGKQLNLTEAGTSDVAVRLGGAVAPVLQVLQCKSLLLNTPNHQSSCQPPLPPCLPQSWPSQRLTWPRR